MNTHAFLNIPNWNTIAEKIYRWSRIHQREIYVSPTWAYWNYVDHDAVLTYTPELEQWFSSQNLTVAWMAILVVYSKDSIPLHIDTIGDVLPPNVELTPDDPFPNDQGRFRFLCPVKNCHGSATRFFDIPIEDYRLVVCEYEKTAYYAPVTGHIKDGETNPYKQIGQMELTAPSVFDSAVPHDVIPNRDINGPRISITIATKESLRHYLLD